MRDEVFYLSKRYLSTRDRGNITQVVTHDKFQGTCYMYTCT